MTVHRRRCRECGEYFVAQVPSTRPSSGKFCSTTCWRANQRATAEARVARITRTCKQCGESFTPTLRSGVPSSLCSRTCWATHVREQRTQTVHLTCATCGGHYERPKAWVRKNGSKYCSRACQGKGRQRAGSSRHRGTGWRKIALSIRNRDGQRCVRCGRTEAEEGRQLAVDHVVPWVLVKADELLANDPANLASLCSGCHGVKTTVTEPRLFRGDWLALQEFYGQERADAAFAKVAAVIHLIEDPA